MSFDVKVNTQLKRKHI